MYSCMSDSVDRIEGISCFLRKILSSVVEVVSLSVVCRRNADCNAGYDIVFCKNPAGLQTACLPTETMYREHIVFPHKP